MNLAALIDKLEHEFEVMRVQGTAAAHLLVVKNMVAKLRELQALELEELDKIDRELGIMRVEGTGVGPLMNARAAIVEMRRLLRGDYDAERDTSKIPRLDRDGEGR